MGYSVERNLTIVQLGGGHTAHIGRDVGGNNLSSAFFDFHALINVWVAIAKFSVQRGCCNCEDFSVAEMCWRSNFSQRCSQKLT